MSDQSRKLFNKGGRTIDFGRGVLTPNKVGTFSKDEAALLLRLFPSELIDMDNVTVEALTSGAVQAKVEADSRQQEAELAKRLENARILRKQKAFEDALEEGFTPAQAREIAELPATAEDIEEKKKEAAATAAKEAKKADKAEKAAEAPAKE